MFGSETVFLVALLGFLFTPGASAQESAEQNLAVQQTATVRLSPGSRPQSTPALIGSRIDGEFSGWEGGTIFKLQNGQMWQQSSYAYACTYAYSPAVLIYRSGAAYKMRVEGLDGDIAVTRLK